MGGSASTGNTQYIYLPTANGPMPIAAIVNGTAYAVHSDHLNTPRKLTQPDGQVAWQWAYSAFGDEQPTVGAKRFTDATTNPTTGTTSIPEVTFNLRYPGQYYDKESNLHYNYFRSYSAERGRYTQADPIGLEGRFNRFGYAEGNALSFKDSLGLATKAEINAAVEILRENFPEIIPNPKSVMGVPDLKGTLGQKLSGRTDLMGNIKYNSDLYGLDGVPIPDCKVFDFLQMMAHELQHVNESVRDRIGLSTGELLNRLNPGYPSVEDIIDGSANIMMAKTIDKFKKKIGGK
ncbi:RHS repeat-associated protein [Acidovorax soli]|uniref:RHS repeat-associated protein n=1 Tax=Acidovorax soli TaxID=592050 RepID=A0A7X0UBK5_9BURK|nr:RHS repeat-associated core domain-containing protein [Acidovorax soli]MBB6561645.1 RHS repeat-associated protein [Acidovorax soli]